MAEKDFGKIPVFDGNNYVNWRFGSIAYLEAKECAEVINGDIKPDSKTNEAWKIKMYKTKNWLQSDSKQEIIKDKVSAYAMLQKFYSLYTVQDIQKKLHTQKQLLNLKFQENIDPNEFFTLFKKHISYL